MVRLLGYLFWAIFLGCVVMLDYSVAAKNRATYTFADHAERRLAEAKTLFARAVENRAAVAPAGRQSEPADEPRAAEQPAAVPPLGKKAMVEALLRMTKAQGDAEPAGDSAEAGSSSPAALAAAAAGAFASISAALSGDAPADPAEATPAASGESALKPVSRLPDKACVMRAGQRSC